MQVFNMMSNLLFLGSPLIMSEKKTIVVPLLVLECCRRIHIIWFMFVRDSNLRLVNTSTAPQGSRARLLANDLSFCFKIVKQFVFCTGFCIGYTKTVLYPFKH